MRAAVEQLREQASTFGNLDRIARFRAMTPERVAQLRPLAKRIWWMSEDEALRFPSRVAAQAMHLNLRKDVALLRQVLTEDELRAVLAEAEIGQFNARSWRHWHEQLRLLRAGQAPPMPVRKLE